MIEIIIAVLLAILIFITKRCLDVLILIQDTVESIHSTSGEELRLLKNSLSNGQVKTKKNPSYGDESVYPKEPKRTVDVGGEQLDEGSSNKSNHQPERGRGTDEQLPVSRCVEPKYMKLRVANGKLTEWIRGKESYYRCWKEGNRILYEFSCDTKESLAINNHSTQIDPFCQIECGYDGTKSAEHVVVVEAGELNEDYTIKSKCVVKFE